MANDKVMETKNMIIGTFGMIKAGMAGYKKTLHGKITDKDSFGNIFFEDNEGFDYIFSPDQIDAWVEKKFSPLGDKFKWDGGVVLIADNNKEYRTEKQ